MYTQCYGPVIGPKCPNCTVIIPVRSSYGVITMNSYRLELNCRDQSIRYCTECDIFTDNRSCGHKFNKRVESVLKILLKKYPSGHKSIMHWHNVIVYENSTKLYAD